MTRTGFFLVGDSHAVAIGAAARAQGRSFKGGPLGQGRLLETSFYTVEDRNFFLGPQFPEDWRHSFKGLLTYPGPILSTVGFNSTRFARDMGKHLTKNGKKEWSALMTRQVFDQCVLDTRTYAVEFYRLLKHHGRQVYFVSSPQRAPVGVRNILFDCESILIPNIEATGARHVDVRKKLGAQGNDIDLKFRRLGDVSHANEAYGAVVLAEFDRLCSEAR